MAHIHELIDLTIAVYVVHDHKVLFIHHKGLDKWLPLGGHVELNEDPEEAVYREVKEESGLDIEIIGDKPSFKRAGVKSLYAPAFLNIHQISETHQHIGLIYFAKSKTDQITLTEAEHHDIRWLSNTDLDDPKLELYEDVKYYAQIALEKVKIKKQVA